MSFPPGVVPPGDEESARRRPWRFMPAMGMIALGSGFGICWPAIARIPQVYNYLGGWVFVLPLLSPMLIYAGFLFIPATFRRAAHRRGPVLFAAALGGFCLAFGAIVMLIFRFVISSA